MTLLIIIAAFVGVATLVGGVALLFRGDVGTAAEDRLEVLAGNKKGGGGGSSPETNLLSSPLDDTRGLAEAVLSRLGDFRKFFEQADSPLTPSKFMVVSGVLAASGGGACMVAGMPMATAPFVGLTTGFLPFIWLFFRRKKRLKDFGKQLPEALELIGRALRAGHSLGSGFSLVSDEMRDPIAREFQRCYEEQNLGIPLEDALEEMTVRVPNLDLRFFATAVILQRQTGGDLAEILDKIGRLIRERFKIWGQIQALTGEGRLSGIVLLALPPALFLAIFRLNPNYVMVLFEDPLGHKMLAVAVIMQILGALVIKKIISIKV